MAISPLQIRSRIDGSLLHICYLASTDKRKNLCPDDALLQVAEINLKKGDTFKAHKHIPTERVTYGTSESWVVLHGQIRVYYYDLDDTLLLMMCLSAGDITITLAGGHNYECLSDNAHVYEFKNGPYMGIEKDKVFI